MTDEDNNYNEKDVAFYDATVNAWYTTKFEKDKHLLSLSAAGIGLLVTLATAVGITSGWLGAIYAIAVLSFLMCILTVLSIFSRNANHLERLLQEKEDNNPTLACLDILANASFIFGIIFTLLVGLSSNIDSFITKEATMTTNVEKEVANNNNITNRSVDGAAKIKVSKPKKTTSGGKNSQSGNTASVKE